jgi:hypothetical protein
MEAAIARGRPQPAEEGSMHEHDIDGELHQRVPDAPHRREAPDLAHPVEALRAGLPGVLSPASVTRLQRAAGNASVGGALGEEEQSPVKEVVGKGGGQPLDAGVRSTMEASFGTDFSSVRVHTDGRASESAKAVQAHAYTVGNDVVFQSGQYAPDSPSGQRMLAHELTHVVQQRQGQVAGTPAPGGIQVSDPGDSFEQAAERTADKVMAGAAVQRQEEEEELQGSFVQRQEEEEEEVQASAVQRMAEPEEEELQM